MEYLFIPHRSRLKPILAKYALNEIKRLGKSQPCSHDLNDTRFDKLQKRNGGKPTSIKSKMATALPMASVIQMILVALAIWMPCVRGYVSISSNGCDNLQASVELVLRTYTLEECDLICQSDSQCVEFTRGRTSGFCYLFDTP